MCVCWCVIMLSLCLCAVKFCCLWCVSVVVGHSPTLDQKGQLVKIPFTVRIQLEGLLYSHHQSFTDQGLPHICSLPTQVLDGEFTVHRSLMRTKKERTLKILTRHMSCEAKRQKTGLKLRHIFFVSDIEHMTNSTTLLPNSLCSMFLIHQGL